MVADRHSVLSWCYVKFDNGFALHVLLYCTIYWDIDAVTVSHSILLNAI